MKTYLKLRKLILVVLPVISVVFAASSGIASAATFNQNRIIDDYVFDNASSMSVSQINSFLNSFPNSCISPNNGFQAPDPTGYSPSGGFTYGGNVTAGQVISDAAKTYGLNPQTILTTLEKEQSLVAGGAGCSVLRYTGAMGYGCPDGGTTYSYSGVNLYTLGGSTVTSVSGTCVNTAAKAGFSQQVIHAAWLLKFGEQRSEGNMGWNIQLTNSPQSGDHWDNSDDPQSCYGGPMTQGTWQVCPSGATTYYDGYKTIDGTSVHMDTGATAALYWYTPHFSGNQNFFSIFTNWFGTTTTSGFVWEPAGQSSFTDSSMTTPVDLTNMVVGQRAYIHIQAKNTGTQTWQRGIVNLGTNNPQNRSSVFYDSRWLSASRAATLDQASVAPGETGSFSFWITASKPGAFKEYFNLVADGYSWMNDWGLYLNLNVQPIRYDLQYTSQVTYTDSSKAVTANLSNFIPGRRYYTVLQFKNTGNQTWQQNNLRLGTSSPGDRASQFYDSSWISPNRAATIDQASVAPGETGSFSFWMTVPPKQGDYKEYFDPVAEGITWLPDYGLYWHFVVPKPVYDLQYTSQGIYSDNTLANPLSGLTLARNTRYFVQIQFKNAGNSTWQQNNLRLGTSSPGDRASQFYDSSWISLNRAATISQSSVDPGGTATIGFWVNTPNRAGDFKEYFDPVAEGITWLPDYGLYWHFVVQ